MNQYHRLHSSRLVALLQQWMLDSDQRDGASPGRDAAEHLSQWLGTVDAVQLGRALHAIESMVPEVPPVRPGSASAPTVRPDLAGLQQRLDAVRSELGALGRSSAAPARAARARADHTPLMAPDPKALAEYAAHGSRFIEVQRQTELRCQSLRGRVREALSQAAPPLRQLVALDAVFEQLLEAREQRLWSLLPGFLERRHAFLRTRHAPQSPEVSAQLAASWQQPGGWLWSFEQDFQALVQAQLQLRLQPVTGLLEAAREQINRESGNGESGRA